MCTRQYPAATDWRSQYEEDQAAEDAGRLHDRLCLRAANVNEACARRHTFQHVPAAVAGVDRRVDPLPKVAADKAAEGAYTLR